jgi:hypothetical protein
VVGYEQMLRSNRVPCSDYSLQLGVVKVLTLIQQTNGQLRQALVSIRRSKVMRQEYRRAAEVAGLSSKEPTHPDSPTRWNSTHDMGVNATAKRFALDSIMEQFVLGGSTLHRCTADTCRQQGCTAGILCVTQAL